MKKAARLGLSQSRPVMRGLVCDNRLTRKLISVFDIRPGGATSGGDGSLADQAASGRKSLRDFMLAGPPAVGKSREAGTPAWTDSLPPLQRSSSLAPVEPCA